MKSSLDHDNDSKLILRGIHLSLTPAMRATLEAKAARLFRHEPNILRARIDVDCEVRGRGRVFAANGRLEIRGRDLTACVATGDAYAAINLLIDKLDRLLRKRTTRVMRRRSSDDIRLHVPAGASE